MNKPTSNEVGFFIHIRAHAIEGSGHILWPVSHEWGAHAPKPPENKAAHILCASLGYASLHIRYAHMPMRGSHPSSSPSNI